MRKFLIFAAVLLYQLGTVAAAEDCPNCPRPSPRVQPAAPKYEWRQDEEEPHWYGLFLGAVQVGAYNSRTQRLYILDPATDKWVESAPAGVKQSGPVGGTEPLTNGVVRGMIKPYGERFSINGRVVTEEEGRGVLAEAAIVPDDSKAPSLTLIGPKEQTARVRADMEKSSVLRPLVSRFLMQEFEPSNPLVKNAGFKTGGSPTIYAEMPDGRVLFRLDEFPGDKAMVQTVLHALQIAEGIRKPDPSYQPASDSGLILPVKPQVNAEVHPAPWVLVLSHFAALVVGLVVGAGGLVTCGIAIRKGLASIVAAELAKVGPPTPPAPATPPAKVGN